MNLANVTIHNAETLEAVPGLGDNGFVRVPKAVRNSLNNRARFVAQDSVGCEIQFVSHAPNIDVILACNKPEFADSGEVRVFKGNFLCQSYVVEPGVVRNIRLTPPERFSVASAAMLDNGGFSPNVWRLAFNRGATFVIHDIDPHGYDLRPPKPEEKPAKNFLAYGSSITNSSLDGYPHVAARKLRYQVQNKGLSGACHCEKELVDYLVDKCQWDFATCELGINMRGCFTPEEFESRSSYLIKRFTETGKPVVIISVFPNCLSPGYAKNPDVNTEREEAYNQILKRLVKDKKAANLHFLPGDKVLDDVTGLSADLLHPSTYGHAIMGANLAAVLKKIVG